ncbi:hypothetical protein LV83_03297 [Algoriphagus yeomjeoni]|uniref:Uncharacterized protein n=1 Tax=Algoriphagus yeomjeoni TaxID=291403 RepID=A0A327P3C7_9BACT|nr:hypothetical protein LV83_03297 [Algoriphagus yeomjeoni]
MSSFLIKKLDILTLQLKIKIIFGTFSSGTSLYRRKRRYKDVPIGYQTPGWSRPARCLVTNEA